jgi:hypothetical protein
MDVRIPSQTLKRCLVAVVLFLSLSGLAVELAQSIWPLQTDEMPLGFVSLSYEQNLPTWFSSHLILICAALLALISFTEGGHGAEYRRHWRGLAFIFVYISLDEAVELHEGLNLLFETSGFLYFGWTIPFGLLVIGLAITYWKFLWDLPPRTRWRFVLAAMLYVGGALGVELPLGYWTDLHGDDNLTYRLLDWLEESLEICGMSVFAWSLGSYLTSGEGGLHVGPVSIES